MNDDGSASSSTDASAAEDESATGGTSTGASASTSASASASTPAPGAASSSDARSDPTLDTGSESDGSSSGSDRDADASGDRDGVGGRRFVVGLYLFLVAFSAVAGLLFARVVANPEPPRLLFLVPLPPTGFGFAVYGGVTVALVLGVPLALVVYVSRRADLADPPKD